MGKKLLLISQRLEDIEFATQVSATGQLELLIVKTAMEGAAAINDHEPSVILVDTSNQPQYLEFEVAIQEKVGMFSDKIHSNAIHFLSSSSLAEVPYLIQSPVFGHYVLRNYGDPSAAGEHYGRIVAATLMERAFNLKSLLRPEAKVQTVILKSSDQKQAAVDAIRKYLEAAQFPSRMVMSIANAVDEILMNAIFDAPVDALGKPTLNQTSRSDIFPLLEQKQVEMNVGYDGHYVAVSAVDRFGSLDKAKLMKHISKIYTDDEYKVRNAVAGAGIGLATVFHAGGSFFFVSESNSRTEVTVFFQRTSSFREFKDQFRFISTQFYF